MWIYGPDVFYEKPCEQHEDSDSGGKEAKENCILGSFVPPFVETQVNYTYSKQIKADK